VADGGWSVVTDIDDTVKITDVPNRRETVLNTFARPFRTVEGVADAFAAWSRRFDPDWHYVSGGPWQLWAALEEFRVEAGLPMGSWHMQEFRAKDRSALRFLGAPVKHKVAEIRQFIRMDPTRRFILVGDSGQGDPEIYGQVAREFPGRIAWIWIRELGDAGADAPRYEKAFGNGEVEGIINSGPSGFVPNVEEISAYKERPPILATIELVDGTPLTEDLPITPDLNKPGGWSGLLTHSSLPRSRSAQASSASASASTSEASSSVGAQVPALVLAPGAAALAARASRHFPPETKNSSNMPSLRNLAYLSSRISSALIASYLLR
jgi:hypothetical protein